MDETYSLFCCDGELSCVSRGDHGEMVIIGLVVDAILHRFASYQWACDLFICMSNCHVCVIDISYRCVVRFTSSVIFNSRDSSTGLTVS